MKLNNLNVVDIFCGAGGLSYGFELAGFNVLLGVDNDEVALKTFQNNHRNVQIMCKDVSKLFYD